MAGGGHLREVFRRHLEKVKKGARSTLTKTVMQGLFASWGSLIAVWPRSLLSRRREAANCPLPVVKSSERISAERSGCLRCVRTPSRLRGPQQRYILL